ncbi:MAG: TIGR04076 family protein [Actinobacteria bacterium]|nr:TIGR04076 family protein [Actinomycetota bacterium]
MSSEFSKCKVTVLKRTVNQDLVDEYLAEEHRDTKPCEVFEEGQEFVLDLMEEVPEEFCTWAWADIRKDLIAIATGADMPGLKHSGTAISACSDWFRPVYFKIERLD